MFEDIFDLTKSDKPDKKMKCGICKWASFVQSKRTGQILCERKKEHYSIDHSCGFYSPRTRKI